MIVHYSIQCGRHLPSVQAIKGFPHAVKNFFTGEDSKPPPQMPGNGNAQSKPQQMPSTTQMPNAKSQP